MRSPRVNIRAAARARLGWERDRGGAPFSDPVAGPLSIPPMAMLELLAGAARAGLVAANLAPASRVARIAGNLALHAVAVGQRWRERHFRHRHLVPAGQRIELVPLHVRQVRLLVR